MKSIRLVIAVAACWSLVGCAGGVLGLIDDIGGSGNDDNVALAERSLTATWLVSRYTGEQVGAVDVPAAANLTVEFTADRAFRIGSDEPVSVGGDETREYDEEGTWRIRDAEARELVLTVTRTGGEAVPAGNRRDVEGTWFLDRGTLVLTTAAIGPGTVRYVMRQAE